MTGARFLRGKTIDLVLRFEENKYKVKPAERRGRKMKNPCFHREAAEDLPKEAWIAGLPSERAAEG